MISHLVPLAVGDLPNWLVPLAANLMRWTSEANGPQGEDDRDHDHRPDTWNGHFFDFLGVLCVALPHDQVATMFLEPIIRFKDEAFHDAAAGFLRGFDRATVATDTRNPENPASVRALFAERMRRGWGFKRLIREKLFTAESHLGDALNAMFYQPSRWANRGRPHIPERWSGFLDSMPTLTALVTEAPPSGYLASIFLNLIESFSCPALLPFTVQATAAWCSAYGVDAHFWSEKGIGPRVCTWFDQALGNDEASLAALAGARDELVKCLDVLIRSGVAQAREIEDKIAEMESRRKSA